MKMRIFTWKRLVFSLVLGFLIPLSYAILLSQVFDYIGKSTPEFLVMPFGWPRPLWIVLMGRQPREGDLVIGLLFIAFCNIALYGILVYFSLFALSMLRRKQPEDGPVPPPPEHT
jgi:hypothetical protein